jgi:hypothetical protein
MIASESVNSAHTSHTAAARMPRMNAQSMKGFRSWARNGDLSR